jgi:hypothetical protein
VTGPTAAKHAHAPRVPYALLLTGLIVGGLALLLLLNTISAANEVRRHNLAVQDASVAAQVQELRNEVAASAAPGNLARAAAALGMVPAGNPAFLVIGTDGAVRELGSAAPASALVLAQQQPRHQAKPAHSMTAAHRSTAAKTTAATSTATKTATTSSSAHPSARSTPARPTPTPTPTVTLPGGNR